MNRNRRQAQVTLDSVLRGVFEEVDRRTAKRAEEVAETAAARNRVVTDVVMRHLFERAGVDRPARRVQRDNLSHWADWAPLS